MFNQKKTTLEPKMTLSITSSLPALNSELREIEKDNITTPAEFLHIRKSADAELEALKNSTILAATKDFQKEIDGAAESLQKLALAARKNKLTSEDRAALVAAVEAQVAYLVLGYKSSVERLNDFNHQ